MIQSSLLIMALQWTGRVEIAWRQIDAGVFQIGKKYRANASGPETSPNHATLVGGFLDVFVQLLHLQDLAFHAGDFTHAGDAPAAVRQTLQLDDDPYRRGDLAPDARYRHRCPGHTDHLLEPLDRVA